MKGPLRWVLYTCLFPLSQLGLLAEIMILTQPGALGGGRVWLAACGVLLALCAGADVLLFRALRQSARLEIAAQRQAMLEQSLEAQRRRGSGLSRHGWGLEILRQIAQRDDGRLETELREGVFTATLWLPLA